MADDYEIDDECPCPACGNSFTHSRHCGNIHCNDGFEDLYEEDPVNNSPGEFETCEDCSGTGIERWCPKCGADYWRARAGVGKEKEDEL